MNVNEQDPLLARNYAHDDSLEAHAAAERRERTSRARAAVHVLLALAFVVAIPVMFFVIQPRLAKDGLPKDPVAAVELLLRGAPVIDGHIDLPELVRMSYANNVSAVDLNGHMPGDVDIPRLREGRVGGFFWSVYTSCPSKKDKSKDFTKPHNAVRDTLEQIDVAKQLMDKHSDTFAFVTSSTETKLAIAAGRIAGLIGIEGAHQIGNSLGVLRQLYSLGARYMTLTHSCNNAFADSAGIFEEVEPVHGGLSALGRTLVVEMNRLGMLVDVSHVSDKTAEQAIALSRAPVIWSHSAVRALNNISRNAPDHLLRMVREDAGRDGVIMINFAPYFIRDGGRANLYDVANHVEHAANVAGRDRVGLGSDYDGVGEKLPTGLADVSKYPNLLVELRKRGWSRAELSGLTGGNVMRVLAKAETVASQMRSEGVLPAQDLYSKRKDLPAHREL